MSLGPSDPTPRRDALLAAGVLLFVLAAWILVPRALSAGAAYDWPTRGQIGDSFGSVNALFSGLAFAGILYAIVLQRRELALQREELRLSRDELATQNRVLAEQLAAMQSSLALEQKRALAETRPLFVNPGGGYSGSQAHAKIQNLGAAITGIRLVSKHPESIVVTSYEPHTALKHQEYFEVRLRTADGSTLPTVTLTFEYVDGLSESGRVVFEIQAGTATLRPVPSVA